MSNVFTAGFLGKLLPMQVSLSRIKSSMTIAVLVASLVLAGHSASAQLVQQQPSQPLATLKSVSIPEPDNLKNFIKDKVAAIALGKTLFWDMQLGSDGIQSCASCHFHAGADNRSKNQINPGQGNIFNIGGAPNYQLTAADYPFHKLADPNNRKSNVLSDSNDITGSQGVFKSKFVDVVVGSDKDNVTPEPDDVFNVKGTNVRQVTGRNSPTTINAVFNFRNFWDGRAQNIFNGVNEWGLRDRNAFVLRANTPNQLTDVRVWLKNSSLASQAVGPPLSAFETFAENTDVIAPFRVEVSEGNQQVTVSEVNKPDIVGSADSASETNNQLATDSAESADDANNQLATDSADSSAQERVSNQPIRFRRFGRKLGKKLIALKPLAKQVVHPEDSILGPIRATDKGLNKTYEAMIQEAFQPEWWNSNIVIQVDPKTGERTFIPKPNRPLSTIEYTLSEYNFALFFGLAVQAYESTLVSDNAPIDQYLEGNKNALTAQQRRGLEIFQNKGKCINCHGGAEFTNASVKNVQNERLERMVVGDGGQAVYDNGFYNIGVRPTEEDLGVGGKDPFGNPLSESRLAQLGQFRRLLGAKPNIRVGSNQRITADGAFKVPGLRNVELTAPYFHNGGNLTLEQVVEFYNRGGDFHEQNIANLDADIQNLNLSAQEKGDLVAFLKSLTDERVRFEKAPFDHPQLFVPNGHPGNQNSVTNDGNGQATDQLQEIPAVGRNGGNGTLNFLGS